MGRRRRRSQVRVPVGRGGVRRKSGMKMEAMGKGDFAILQELLPGCRSVPFCLLLHVFIFSYYNS